MIFAITTYYSSNRIKKNMVGGARRGVAYRVLVWQPEGKSLGRLIHGWEGNIIQVGGGFMDWIDLPQDVEMWRAAVKAVKEQRVSKNAGNFWTTGGITGLPEEFMDYWRNYSTTGGISGLPEDF